MQEGKTRSARAWMAQAVLIVFAVYFYVFMEWLFFLTKPSFMSSLGKSGTVRVLFATPAPFVVTGIAVVVLCWIPALIIRKRAVHTVCLSIVRLITAGILAGTFFLLIDNFTYTLFDFGVRSTEGFLKLVYGIVFVVLVVFSFILLGGIGKTLPRSAAYRVLLVVTPVLVVLSILTALASRGSGGLLEFDGDAGGKTLKHRPNIFLISSDALNAAHMSIYGYRRATTPFLDSLADRILVCENNFPNAGTSGASIASMLTGKLPTQTKLIYPPEILQGKDAYQHLPGILRLFGYRNIDISIRLHADPEDLNLRNSFHWANFREISERRKFELSYFLLGQDPTYFLQRMRYRATERLRHVTGIRKMEDPLGEVVRPIKKRYGRDAERIRSFFQHVRGASSPLFVHMHLLGTHGPIFKPERRLFSRGKKQHEHWETDFYDDAILTFDNYLKRIVGGLGKTRVLRNSVIVIFSDHGQNFTVNDRLPLIFFFPNGEHSGRVRANTQNLDIAATVLDYMGVAQPDWMGGMSLISSGIEPDRFIFCADPKHRIIPEKNGQRVADRNMPKPPFFSLVAMGVHCCHKYFELELASGVLNVLNTPGHTAPCPESDLPDPLDVGRMIIDHLEENGYDTSSIKKPLSARNLR